MNNDFYNKEIAMRENEHAAGCILLERANNGNWIAMEWSAFFIYLLLHTGTCRYYLDGDSHAVAELSESDLHALYRLLTMLLKNDKRIVFGAFGSCKIPHAAFAFWKERLKKEETG